MEHRAIGSLSVSIVGLGCNNFGGRMDAAATASVVTSALDAGINFFDTADVYGGGLSEEYLGKALGARRSEAVIATKFGAPNSSKQGLSRGGAAWIEIAVERSLRRLGTDHIDHYQLHFPDADVPIEETLRALEALVQAGKVREIGCSNFGSTRLYEADQAAKEKSLAPFRTVQNRYSVLHRDPEPKVVPACRELGIGLIPYFPLESGLLSGKYRQGQRLPEGTRLAAFPEGQRERFTGGDNMQRVEKLHAYAESKGYGLLDLAVSWLTSNPVVTSVIAGATRPQQVAANAAACGWRMTEEDRAEIDRLLA
jgi:aryl-alcohol dehydrogenase-like predicted oxidoreductase